MIFLLKAATEADLSYDQNMVSLKSQVLSCHVKTALKNKNNQFQNRI